MMKSDPLFQCLHIDSERDTNLRNKENKKFERDGKSLVLDTLTLT